MGIKDQVHNTLGAQIRQEVNKQILGYIPVPLDKQVAESARRLSDMKIALANS